MTYTVRQLQTALVKHGFNPGKVDGVYGPATEKAVIAFKRSNNLRSRPYIGPLTEKLLFAGTPPDIRIGDLPTIPYMNLVAKWIDVHESSAALERFLASDGKTVGDPDDIAWCAEMIQTTVALTLPNEPWPGKLKTGWAGSINWLEFGDGLPEARYGCIGVFWRGSPNGWKGHLAIIVGYDPARHRYRILGSNQRDTTSYTWIDADRIRPNGFRVPSTLGFALPPLPIMDSRGAILSTNEA